MQSIYLTVTSGNSGDDNCIRHQVIPSAPLIIFILFLINFQPFFQFCQLLKDWNGCVHMDHRIPWPSLSLRKSTYGTPSFGPSQPVGSSLGCGETWVRLRSTRSVHEYLWTAHLIKHFFWRWLRLQCWAKLSIFPNHPLLQMINDTIQLLLSLLLKPYVDGCAFKENSIPTVVYYFQRIDEKGAVVEEQLDDDADDWERSITIGLKLKKTMALMH